MLFSLTSCTNSMTVNGALAQVESFISAVSKGDLDAAKGYMHPYHDDGLETFFEELKSAEDIDLSEGVGSIEVDEVYYSFYNTEVKGPYVELSLIVEVGDEYVYFVFLVIENSSGYGIADIYAEKYVPDSVDDAPQIEM